jgi:hypothetical protein
MICKMNKRDMVAILWNFNEVNSYNFTIIKVALSGYKNQNNVVGANIRKFPSLIVICKYLAEKYFFRK